MSPPPPSKRNYSLANVGDRTTTTTAEALEMSGLKLLHLLLQCAEKVSTENLTEATDLLLEISELSSPFGSTVERVAAYFGDALRAKIVNSYIGLKFQYPVISSNFKTLRIHQMQKFHGALQSCNSITPLIKFSHFTANQAIYQALDGEDRIHIIDLDIMQGLQWPGFFHILASRRRKVQSLRVTGFGPCVELLEQTGKRLAEFAAALAIPFEFHPVEGKIGEVTELSRLVTGTGEARVIHWMQHGLYDTTGSDLGSLRALKWLKPKLITLVEQDLSTKKESFLCRFVEALHYYSAMFDALGEGGDHNGLIQRHQVEQQLFGCEIRNVVGYGGGGGGDPKSGGEGGLVVKRWGEELTRVGFRPVSLAGSPAAAQANMLLGMNQWNWNGYTLVEEKGCLRLGWKDLALLTASAWEPCWSEFDG